jgi:hypothetical protein
MLKLIAAVVALFLFGLVLATVADAEEHDPCGPPRPSPLCQGFPAVRRPGFQYAELVGGDHGCGVFVHRKTEWRPRRELHVSCTIHAGASSEGALFRYEFPVRGLARKFGAVIEDRTHGAYGDIPYVRVWREGRFGYVHVPGPSPARPNGVYVHIEHVYWNVFRGVREDRL